MDRYKSVLVQDALRTMAAYIDLNWRAGLKDPKDHCFAWLRGVCID
jgi:hypothetical protein